VVALAIRSRPLQPCGINKDDGGGLTIYTNIKRG